MRKTERGKVTEDGGGQVVDSTRVWRSSQLGLPDQPTGKIELVPPKFSTFEDGHPVLLFSREAPAECGERKWRVKQEVDSRKLAKRCIKKPGG